jgi:hypothetical protein
MSADWVAMNYVVFAERSLQHAMFFYAQTASRPSVIKAEVVTEFIRSLRRPLALKYDCPAQTTWKLGVEALISIVDASLPIILRNKADVADSDAIISDGMWVELATTLAEFWFSPSGAYFMESRGSYSPLLKHYLLHVLKFVLWAALFWPAYSPAGGLLPARRRVGWSWQGLKTLN